MRVVSNDVRNKKVQGRPGAQNPKKVCKLSAVIEAVFARIREQHTRGRASPQVVRRGALVVCISSSVDLLYGESLDIVVILGRRSGTDRLAVEMTMWEYV